MEIPLISSLTLTQKYVGIFMNRCDYMRISVKHIPTDVIWQYNFVSLVINGRIMVEIRNGMYSLSQVGLLVQKRLNTHLNKFGYTKCEYTPSWYAHHTQSMTFTLIVYDFSIKYHSTSDAPHLLSYLRKLYEHVTGWPGSLYIYFSVQCDSTNHRWVKLSIPGYIEKTFVRFCIYSPVNP